MNKIILFMKKNYIWLIALICLIITIGIVEDVFGQDIMRCDVLAYNFFVGRIRNDTLTNIMIVITAFGSATILILISCLLLFLLKDKKKSICSICNLTIIGILNQLTKFIIQRPRPNGYRLVDEGGYSFPSGHSMVSMAFYGFLIYLIYKYVKNKKIKWIIIVSLSILILLIGISRIYLGVHYASDVIAGALISIVYLIIYIKVIKKRL